MLYRIQTLYLLISIFFYSVSSFLIINKKITKHWLSQEIVKISLILCLILSIVSFFLFKKRKIQILLNEINIFSNTLSFMTMLFFIDHRTYAMRKNVLFLFFLFFCDLALYMANRSLQKERKIIDSINKIR